MQRLGGEAEGSGANKIPTIAVKVEKHTKDGGGKKLRVSPGPERGGGDAGIPPLVGLRQART